MINIRGILIPASWDAEGNVVGMAIATHNEEEYFIENDDKTARLYAFLRQEVNITGVLKSKGGDNIIKINKVTKKKEHY